MKSNIKPLVALEIFPMDIIFEADEIQEGIELSEEQIINIMQKVKQALKDNPDFYDEYFAVVRNCVEDEIKNV